MARATAQRPPMSPEAVVGLAGVVGVAGALSVAVASAFWPRRAGTRNVPVGSRAMRPKATVEPPAGRDLD
jgi:hypothetical protein